MWYIGGGTPERRMKTANVLIFPAGSEIGLEILNSLRYSNHVVVFGATSKKDHTEFAYQNGKYCIDEKLNINHPEFLSVFNTLLNSWRIDFIYPTHDSVALYLKKNQDELVAKVLTSSLDTVLVARNKKLTYTKLSGFNFCPKVFDSLPSSDKFPVVIKPSVGEGGKNVQVCSTREEGFYYLNQTKGEVVLMEYLPGGEITVDCFTDRHGRLLFIGPRTRNRVEMGISFNTVSIPLTDEVRYVAEALNKTFAFHGAWFFQLKRDASNQYKLLEFAARQSSSMALYRYRGINFALLTLFDALEYDLTLLNQDFTIELDRCLKNSVKLGIDFNHVYIDFDDTLIIRNQVCLPALAFLYQCQNKNIPVTLITKHEFNIRETLKKFNVSEDLFDSIIQVREDCPKSEFIERKNSIFIDNHFFERKSVAERLGIPVFDVDTISGLLEL